MEDADRKLTQTYERCLSSLTLENQKALREAQVAWIKYTEQTWVSLKQLGDPETSKAFGQRIALAVLERRTAQLRGFFISFSRNFQDNRTVKEREDQKLDAVYAQCIAKLPPQQQEHLREAQRAWLEYRDLDADATVLAARQVNRNSFRGWAAKANLTSMRTKELRGMALS